MLAYTGEYKGREISVMGSGMGVPSFSLYAAELFQFYGVEAIIRVGSAGGRWIKLSFGIVIATSASTDSVYMNLWFPNTSAPSADYELLSCSSCS